MKSFSTWTQEKRDQKIPRSEIPIIIIHWLHVHYYGGRLTIADLRAFLEPRLRSSLHSREAVTTWLNEAWDWMNVEDKKQPGRSGALLAEYFQLQVAA